MCLNEQRPLRIDAKWALFVFRRSHFWRVGVFLSERQRLTRLVRRREAIGRMTREAWTT